MRYLCNIISSKAYWQYTLLSRAGVELAFAFYGGLYLIVQSLDFFGLYTKDKYASYTFILILVISVALTIATRRPITRFCIKIPKIDIHIEVKIANLFDSSGSIMISTNTKFEMDVAGGKIAPDSLQGQFTARFFNGNQPKLINEISAELTKINGSAPYPMGTTIPIITHGKTFYFTAMSEFNTQGNASTTIDDLMNALNGLWTYVRNSGELQELSIPVIGTGRGRIKISRKKMVALIAESFVKASEQNKFTDKLSIIIRPEDARNFEVNLYDIKDNLNHVLHS